MAIEPRSAKEKRSEPPRRQNAQGDHEGGAHSPAEYDAVNPQTQTGQAGAEPGGRKSSDRT
jgi:hypothetical protein